MLAYRQQQAVEEFLRDEKSRNATETDNFVALECWKFDDLAQSLPGCNYRRVDLACGVPHGGSGQQGLEDMLRKWLHFEVPYRQLPVPPNAGGLSGGIRVILCDRPNLRTGMAMSHRCFSMISNEFQLHQLTLPLFCADRGAYVFYVDSPSATDAGRTISVVMKFPQKVEIANYTLSLTYNLDNGWTHAWICGAGVVTDRESDAFFGSQRQQLLDAIISMPHAWTNPLFLPAVLLDNYTARLDWRAHHIDLQLSRLESRLGVTFVGKAGRNLERRRWPLGINTEEANIDVQTISTHLSILSSCTQWSQDCLSGLLRASTQVSGLREIQVKRIDMLDLRQSAEALLTLARGVHSRFNMYTTRANLQSNVLFNVISQQENISTRQDTRLSFHIAKASKQDSTSLMTFTFITALFLPGTFVATVFSMSMFDFNPTDDPATGSSSLAAGGFHKYVSNKFWVFWCIAVPLTLVTMAIWYSWSRYANQKWQEELQQAAPPDDEDLGAADPVTVLPRFGRESALDASQLGSLRRRSATAGISSKDEIRTWWRSPGLV